MNDPATDDNDMSDPVFRAVHRFEYGVVLILVVTVGVITLLALGRLFFGIYNALFIAWAVDSYHSIQVLFGMVMTVLIALEFGNSILRHIRDHSTIIQARAVILIGMMAVVRKVMIIDLSVASPWQLLALGAVAISLACAYWFMRED